MRTRLFVAFTLLVGFGLLCAAAAPAETLQTGPATLLHVGFETTSDSLPLLPYAPEDNSVPATSTWGRMTARSHTGDYALWCAGSVPASWPTYPSPTRGTAIFELPDTSGYYQSSVQYSYFEPAWGALEGAVNPFKVDCIDASRPTTASVTGDEYVNPFLPLAPAWSTQTVIRGGTGNPSKTAAHFRFVFHGQPLDAGDAEGAWIDDVGLLGYKYGPVGNLSAARRSTPHSTVDVTWTAATSPSGGTAYYVVWRHDLTTGAWTQATPARISATSFADSGVPVNHSVAYVVQPWDGAVSTADWGPYATSATVAAVPGTTITGTFAGSQTATTVPYAGKVRVSGRLADVDGTAVTGQASSVAIQSSPDNSTWSTATVATATAPAEGPTGSYASTVTVTSTTYLRLSFAGANGYSASRSTPGILATVRPATTSWGGLSLSVPSPKYGANTNFTGTLSSESGSMPGVAGNVVVQTSSDGSSSWQTSTTAVVSEISPSAYRATLHITAQPVYVRFHYSGDAQHYAVGDSSAVGPITYQQNTQVLFDAVTVSSTTPGFPGKFQVAANLMCENGPVLGRTTVICEVYRNALLQTTVGCVEDSPGHYVANAPVYDTGGSPTVLAYRLKFPGDAQYAGPVTSDYAPNVTPKPANNIAFGDVSVTPTVPVSGGSVTARVHLRDASNAPVSSTDVTVTLYSSPDASTWVTVSAGIVDTQGDYSGVVPNITALTYIRFGVAIKNTAVYDMPVDQNSDPYPWSGQVSVTPPTSNDQVGRLSGDSRYTTAIAIGKQAFPDWTGVRDVVIASGDNRHMPDALTAAGLAGAYNGPVLLVPTASLESNVKAALQQMPTGVRVHIVGGTPSVSAIVASKIAALSHVKSVDRIYGSDRYATAVAVANRMKSILGASLPHTVLLTTGADSLLLDPLIASTASANRHFPVLLVQRLAVPSSTSSAMNSLGLTTRYIVGGEGAVGEGVRTSLGIPVDNRIAGSDLAGDAAAFATRARSEGWLAGSAVGFAAAVPDAATGGLLMGKLQGPMLLVSKSAVPSVTSDYLTANRAVLSSGYVFGGTPTVDESVRATLQSLIN